MNQINLLPKPHVTQKYFLLLLIAVLVILAGLSVMLLYQYQDNRKEHVQSSEQILTLNQKITTRRSDLAIDPTTRSYHQFANDISKLMAARREWNVILDKITEGIPNRSYIQSITATADDITMNMEIVGLDVIAEYAESLRNIDMFESVKVSNVTLITKDVLETSNQSTYRVDLNIRLHAPEQTEVQP